MKKGKFGNVLFCIALFIGLYLVMPGLVAKAAGFDVTTGWLIGIGVFIGHST